MTSFNGGRRSLLAALGATALGAGLATPAIAKSTKRLTMVTGWPRGMTALHGAAERFARRVADLSDGDLTIEVFASGEKVGALETLAALQSGAAHLSHGTSYYWVSRSHAFAFFATVPFGMMASEHFTWLAHGGGQALWDEVGESVGVKPLACGNTGVQAGGWFRQRIETRADLEGKVLRFPGIGGELFKELGAIPKLTSADQIGPMLEAGELDAVEWVSPWVDLEFGLQNYCKFYYYPGVHEPGHTLELNVALPVWNELGARERAILKNASEAECTAMPIEFAARNADVIDTLVREHGVSFLRMPNDVIGALRRVAPEIVERFAASDDFTKRVHASYADFQRRIGRWAEYSDRAYWRARFT